MAHRKWGGHPHGGSTRSWLLVHLSSRAMGSDPSRQFGNLYLRSSSDLFDSKPMEVRRNARQFRFENVWVEEPGCGAAVQQTWGRPKDKYILDKTIEVGA